MSKELRAKLERLLTSVEVELEAPNLTGGDDRWDEGFGHDFEDIKIKLNKILECEDD